MKRWLVALGMLGGLLALVACAAEEKATPAPATTAPAVGKPAWEEEWDRVLAVARQEGKVALTTAGRGTETQRALTEPFEKKYGIKVEYLSQTGGEMVARFKTERAAGQYL
ncbi:MAG TPA: hypothetical protein VJ256_07125 [Dehalococcoidia bacterium]|nr:hypothetical protein [Dehalococcoidia bacterium]